MFTWLLYNTLCALPLAALALVVRRVAKGGAALEHALWALVLVRLVLPPLAWLDAGAGAPGAGPSIVASGEPTLGDELVAAATRAFGRDWSTQATRILLVLFLATLAFVAGRELLRARAVERCVRRARPAPRALERHVAAVAARLGVRAPRLCLSAEAGGPFLWSLRRPVLVLPDPEEAAALPAPTVLAHEFAHLRRRDHWTAWLELLVQAFHFWNPLFWLARRRLHVCAELACDSWVVENFPSERRAFATALLDTAERAAGAAFVPRAVQAIGRQEGGMASEASAFEERLREILTGRPRAALGQGVAVLGAALVLAIATLPGVAAPSLARFRAALPELPTGIDRTTWERSLAAADERLQVAPDDGDALAQRGVALLGLGRTDDAIAAFQRQVELGHQPGKALYNEACARVHAGDVDGAFHCLERAALLDFPVGEYALQDPDLEPLRGDERLTALLDR